MPNPNPILAWKQRAEAAEGALAPFAQVYGDVEPTPEERTDIENHGFDPLDGEPYNLGPDAPTIRDYRRAHTVLQDTNESEDTNGR